MYIVYFYYVFFAYIYSLFVIVTLASMHLYVLVLKLRQLGTFIEDRTTRKEQRFSPFQELSFRQQTFTYFRGHFVSVLKYFTAFNRLYGALFSLFILFNFPVSAFLVMSNLLSSISTTRQPIPFFGRLYIYFYSSFQYICLFLLHYKCAAFIGVLNTPLKRLYQQVVVPEYHRVGDFRLKFKMSLFLQGLVGVCKKVGVTYGPFGLVTMRSFVMVWKKIHF